MTSPTLPNSSAHPLHANPHVNLSNPHVNTPLPTSTTAATTAAPFDPVAESGDKIYGMENFGNTCYCNSVLQCLYYLQPFRKHVLEFGRSNVGNSTTENGDTLDNTGSKTAENNTGNANKPYPRKCRTTTPGLKPHPFVVDANSASLSGSGSNATTDSSTNGLSPYTLAMANAQAQHEARQRAQINSQYEASIDSSNGTNGSGSGTIGSGKKPSMSIGRRLSLFAGGGKKENKNNNGNLASATPGESSTPVVPNYLENDEEHDLNSSTVPSTPILEPPPNHHQSHQDILSNNLMFDPNNPASYTDYKMLYPALRGLTLGMRVPTQNSPVVGYTADPFATNELRKRAALTKGPIINLDHSYAKDYNMQQSMFTSLKDIFDCMAESSSQIGVVSPVSFIEMLKRTNELFRSSMHQDAHEFLNYIMNDVFESVDAYAKSNNNNTQSQWIHDLFEGLLTSETKCLTCETVSRRDEQFLDLSIDIELNTSITSCLRQFSASEMLCQRNKFNCDNCGGFHEAQKRMKIKRLPKLLALHLKRFKYTEDLQRNVKLFHRVVYPRFLRLFNTTDDAEDSEKLYELQSVVVHIGGGPYHGHYVSVVKTENAGWLLFDDEMVESVDPNYVFGFFGDNNALATAYVLFYQEVEAEQVEREMLKSQMGIGRNNNNVNNVNGNTASATNGYAHQPPAQEPLFREPFKAAYGSTPVAASSTTVNTFGTQSEASGSQENVGPNSVSGFNNYAMDNSIDPSGNEHDTLSKPLTRSPKSSDTHPFNSPLNNNSSGNPFSNPFKNPFASTESSNVGSPAASTFNNPFVNSGSSNTSSGAAVSSSEPPKNIDDVTGTSPNSPMISIPEGMNVGGNAANGPATNGSSATEPQLKLNMFGSNMSSGNIPADNFGKPTASLPSTTSTTTTNTINHNVTGSSSNFTRINSNVTGSSSNGHRPSITGGIGLGLSRFKSSKRGSIVADHLMKGGDNNANGSGNGQEGGMEKGRRNSRLLSFGFKKH